MNLWLMVVVVLFCAGAGVLIGLWLSGLRSPYWLFGYVIPLVLVILYALALWFPTIMFLGPVSLLTMGTRKFAMFAFIGALLLTTPLSRIPGARARKVVVVLLAAVVLCGCVWPILVPLVDRRELNRLQTKINPDGICLQTTGYTCGPAAAVTALRKLQLPAEEGRIAVLSWTSDLEGTPPDMLAVALRKEYRGAGLRVRCRVFKDISELKQAGLTLAVLKYSLLEDHWVTVLEVTDSQVIIADPQTGRIALSYDDFRNRWRFIGIVLERRVPV